MTDLRVSQSTTAKGGGDNVRQFQTRGTSGKSTSTPRITDNLTTEWNQSTSHDAFFFQSGESGAPTLKTPAVAQSTAHSDNADMTTVSREELDAKLDALRSDVRAGNADLRAEFHAMRADMANTRSAMAQELAAVVASMGDLKASAGEVKGSLDGVKTSLHTVQWLVGTLLAAAALYVAMAQFLAPQLAVQQTPQQTSIGAPASKDAKPAASATKP